MMSLLQNSEIQNMFANLGYTGSLTNISQPTRPYLRKEWYFFFDQLA